jgi:tetratricopeptide (TPR) repeat protein
MLEHRTYVPVLGLIIILNEIKCGENVKTILPYLLAIYFLFFVSSSLVNSGKFADKLNFATAAMIETPLNVKTTFLYARRSLDNGTFQFGEYFMKKNYDNISIKEKQKNIASSAYLGIFAWQRGDIKPAKKYLTLAVDKETPIHQAYAALADIYVSEGRYEDAVLNMKKAFKLQPENAEYFRFLKLCFEKRNNNE